MIAFISQDTEKETTMRALEKFLSDDPSLADVVSGLVAGGAMDGEDLDIVLNKRAAERRQPGETFFSRSTNATPRAIRAIQSASRYLAFA